MRALLLTVLVLSAAPVAGQDLDAKAIIKKAVEAHGGEAALKKYAATSSKGSGTIKFDDKDIPATFEIAYEQPGKLRMSIGADFGVQKIAMLQIMNGDKFKSTMNGAAAKISDVEKAELKQAVVMQDLSMLYPLLGEKYTLTKEKDDKVEGKDAYVVGIVGKGFKAVKAYFDKATGLMVKHGRKGMANGPTGFVEVYEEATLSDIKKVDGVMVPYKMTVTHNAKPFMSVTMTEIRFLDKLDPKLFAVDD